MSTRPPLRQPGRILILSCYELGHAPHGLVLPRAFLERAGFAPACVDLSVEPLDDDAIDRARLVLISVPMHTALRLGVAVADRIRARNPSAILGFFGLYAAMNADTLRGLGAAFAIGGEVEQALVAIAEDLAGRPGPKTEPVAGPAADAGERIRVKLRMPRLDRTRLPGPDRYARLDTGDGSRRVIGYSETSRGCLDRCRHCPVPAVYGGRFFVLDREAVLDDIAQQIARGAGHITFGDPDFLNGPGHSMAVVRELAARFPGVSFDITTQIANLDRHRHLIPELARLGCAFVVSAVESLSDRVLTRLGKRHRRSDVERVLDLTRAAGLPIRPTFVTFTPWTTLDDLCELTDFLWARDLAAATDPIQLTVRLLVPPGSLLLPDLAFGPLDRAALSHRWTHPDPRVDALHQELTQRVTRGAERDEDPLATLADLTARIHRRAGRPAPRRDHRVPRRIPRITEPWFC